MVITVRMWAFEDDYGRKAQGEEAGVGEVSKVCENNRPLEAPLPDHRATERQLVPVFNTGPAENQSNAAFRLKPEFTRTSVS